MVLQPKDKLVNTSLTFGLAGWVLYILQGRFDFTIGLLLDAVTAGISAACSTVLDILPFVLWLVGIVTGHVALSKLKYSAGVDRSQAIWG
jgi:mannose/fructose/N-acetylgalactosamine-specific phosphotransferase system component IID